MKYLVAIASLATIGWTSHGRPRAETSQSLPDTESVIAREIARGAPRESTGMESDILGAIPLEAYGRTLEGGEFRLREVVLLPGAKIRVHGHDDRPAIAYVLEGELVEHRNDSEEPLIRRMGDHYFEGPGVVHWVENVSGSRVRVISTDIVPPATE